MYKNKLLYIILIIILTPLFYFMYLLIESIFKYGINFNFKIDYLINSIILSGTGAFLSLFFGFILSLTYYTIKKELFRTIFIIILFSIFIIEPIILLSVFQNLYFFKILSPFYQTLFIETLHLLPLSAILLIYMFNSLNINSIKLAIKLSNIMNTIKYIILPILAKRILFIYLFIYILIFISQDVSSILAYRTYSEELLNNITLLDNISQIILYTLPSLLLVLLIFFVSNKDIIIQNKNYTSIYFSCNICQKVIFSILGIYLSFVLFKLYANINSNFFTLINENISIIFDSIVISIIVSLITLIISLLLKNIIKHHIKLYMFLFAFYMLMPHSIISLILINLSQKLNIDISYLIFIVGYIFTLLPISMILVYIFKIELVDDDFLFFLKTNLIGKLKFIHLPKNKNEIIVTIAILMLFSLNELSVSILLTPPGFETIIVKIYNLLHYGDISTVSFLSLIQIIITAIVIIFVANIKWGNKKYD